MVKPDQIADAVVAKLHGKVVTRFKRGNDVFMHDYRYFYPYPVDPELDLNIGPFVSIDIESGRIRCTGNSKHLPGRWDLSSDQEFLIDEEN